MTNGDQGRADKTARAAADAKAAKTEQNAASKAVLDNMARLKALRLAREAAEPPRAVTARKVRAKTKTPDKKAPALSEWLASQQNGGRRT